MSITELKNFRIKCDYCNSETTLMGEDEYDAIHEARKLSWSVRDDYE